jgi:hypothetical protein
MDPAKDDANLYRYVRNNPVNAVDPSGLAEIDELNARIRERLNRVDPAVAAFVEEHDVKVVSKTWSFFGEDAELRAETKEFAINTGKSEYQQLMRLRGHIRILNQFKEFEKENFRYSKDSIRPTHGSREWPGYVHAMREQAYETMRLAGATEAEITARQTLELASEIFGSGGLIETALLARSPWAARTAVQHGRAAQANQRLLDAHLAKRIPENIQDAHGNPGLRPGTIIYPDPAVNEAHVFKGEINKKGSAVGFHHRPSGNDPATARLTSIIDSPNASGVYTGKIEVLDHQTGKWVAKNGYSTFFPDAWSPTMVLNEIRGAYANGHAMPGKPLNYWEGVSPSGLRIGGYASQSGSINTAFPIY